MEKILIGMNATLLNPHTLDFACYLANLTHSQLTGVFLNYPEADDYPVMKMAYGAPYVETIVAEDIPGASQQMVQLVKNKQLFRDICNNRGVSCSSHRDKGVPLDEMVAESRYADLLVVDPEMSFEIKREDTPTRFVRDLLSKAECPVAVAPYNFYGVSEIVFACDDSASSLFAIKQFTYLFPALAGKPLTVVQVAGKEKNDVNGNQQLLDYLQLHYSSIGFRELTGKATDELFGFLLERKNAFVVMGSYGRSLLSDFFKKSTAELVIKTVNLPIFIAHH